VGKNNPHAHHSSLLVQWTPLFETNRKRGSKYQLKFFKAPQAIKRPGKKHHSYVKYISTQLGEVSVAQSSVQTTGSEDNVVHELDKGDDWIDAGNDELPLDQAYLDHISKEVVDERVKRVRPKGVSPKVCASLKKANLGNRTRPFDNGNFTVINFWKSSSFLKGGANGHQRCV
jgi:hypothetical protein